MGLFALNDEKIPTVKGLVETAKLNISLFEEYGYEYLLLFAISNLKNAHELAEQNKFMD